MIKINTTSSIRGEIKKAISAVGSLIEGEVKDVEADVKTVEADIERDVSPIIHSISVVALENAKDITIVLQHAAGETRRIVINGTLTVEGLIARLRSMTGK